MKNYRHFGDEMEILGNRLDYARQAFANSKTEWSKNFWKQTVNRLLFQWKQLPILHDGNVVSSIIPRWDIDYNFYELARPHENYGITDKFYDRLFKHDAELDASWNAHREQRLAKAQH